MLVLRVYWFTVDPLYSSTDVNRLAIITCVASSIYLYYVDQPLAEGGDQSCAYKQQSVRRMFALRSFVVAMAFGALLFLTNWLFGETSVVGALTRSQLLTTPKPFLDG